MCMQDVKIGRGTQQAYAATTVAGATAVQLVGGAADRVSLVVSTATDISATPYLQILVGVLVNAVLYPLAVINGVRPYVVLSVEEHGSAVRGAVHASNLTGGSVSVRTVDNILIAPIEEIVQ